LLMFDLKNKNYYFFAILLTIFIISPIFYFSYVPMWDGFLYADCYIQSAQSYTPYCYGHSAAFNNAIFTLSQKIAFGDPRTIYIFNIILGVLGLVCFFKLLKHLFQDSLSESEIVLITFLFGFNPIFMAHIIQPSLDYAMPIYGIILLLCLFKKQFGLASLAGLALCFTKETGVMLYFVTIFLYAVIFIWGSSKSLKNNLAIKAKNSLLLLIPLPIFVNYAMSNSLHGHLSKNLPDFIKEFLTFNASNEWFVAQFKSIAIINFTWIMTISALFGIAHSFVRAIQKRKFPDFFISMREREMIFFFTSALLILWFNTRVEFSANNPRYMLPLLPFLIILFAYSVIQIINKTVRCRLILTLLIFVYTSCFTVIDPVSKWAFGMLDFGGRKILNVRVNDYFIGRDQLVYNFQFSALDFLTKKIIRQYGLNSIYVANSRASFLSFIDFSRFNKKTHQRTLLDPLDKQNGPDLVNVRFLEAESAIKDPNIQEFYFLEYPGKDNTYSQWLLLKSGYSPISREVVSVNGYAIVVVYFVRK
jgi:hypothetical protein